MEAEREEIQQQLERPFFLEDASRNVGVTGRTGDAALVEVDQPGINQISKRGWIMGSYPGGDLEIGYDMPLSRQIAPTHTAAPSLNLGKKPEFTDWTRDARYYAEGIGFLSAMCRIYHSTFSWGNWIPKTRYLSTGGTAARVCTYTPWRGISVDGSQ